MHNKYTFTGIVLIAIAIATCVILFLHYGNVAVLNPKGVVAEKERTLLITAMALMLIVVIPVLVMTFAIIWKYRAENTKATYSPDWDYNFTAEALWWGIPGVIVIALSVLTWTSSHELDPFKPLE